MRITQRPSSRLTRAAALLLPLFLVGCGGDAADEPAPIIPTANPAMARDMLGGRVAIPVQVIDAATGAVLSVPVTLTVQDDDAGQDFHETDGLASPNGLTTLMLKPGVVATAANPLNLRLVTHAAGYFVGGAAVQYGGTVQPVEIRVVSTAAGAQPEGVAAASQTGVTADAGALQTAVSVEATAGNAAANGAGAKFDLPAGAVVRDAAGNALSGPLSVNIAYFSPTTDAAVQSFPGGLSPGSVIDANGNPASGYFITGGFLAVDIVDESGRKAHQLSQPATMTIQVPAGTINPETGVAVVAGDVIPVWSHDEQTGQWSHEQDVALVAGTDGNFDATYTVDHLSYWNLDWYGSTCSLNLTFTGISTMPASGLSVSLAASGQTTATHTTMDLANTFYGAANDRALTITVKVPGTDTVVGSTTVTLGTSCAAVSLPVNAALVFPPRLVDVAFVVSAPQKWTRSQLEYMFTEGNLTANQKTELLAYTHPSDPEAYFVINDAFYAKMAERGATADQIEGVKLFMALRIAPSNGYVQYMLNNDKSTIKFGQLEGGKLKVELPVGTATTVTACGLLGYVNNEVVLAINSACYSNLTTPWSLAATLSPGISVSSTATTANLVLESTHFVVNTAKALRNF